MSIRFSLASAPDVVAAFPLPGALLLPRARLPLNVFEPRYLAMVDDVLKTDHRMIAMIQPRAAAATGKAPLYDVGCAGRITTFSETEDGRYMIALTGVCRFRVAGEVDGFTPYRRVRPNWTPFAADLVAPKPDPTYDSEDLLAVVDRYFQAKSLDADRESLMRADEETLVNALSMLCPFAPEEKQALIERNTLAERRDTLRALMEIGAAEGDDDEPRGSLQ